MISNMRTQWVTFRVKRTPREGHSNPAPRDGVQLFDILQAAKHRTKDNKSLLLRQLFLREGAETFVVNLEKKVTLRFVRMVLEQASDPHFMYSLEGPVETTGVGEKFAPGEREARGRCKATIEHEAARITAATGLFSAEFVLVDATHKVTYMYDGRTENLTRWRREPRSANADVGAAADTTQLPNERAPGQYMHNLGDSKASGGNESRAPALECSPAMKMAPAAGVHGGGHQRISSEPAYMGQTAPGSSLHSSSVVVAPRALDFVDGGKGGGANENGAGGGSSWESHQPWERQTSPRPVLTQDHSTPSSCDDEISFGQMDVLRGVSRSASSFDYCEGEYPPEEKEVPPALPSRPAYGMGAGYPDNMEVMDGDSPSTSGFGVDGSTGAMSGAVGLRTAAWAALAKSKLQQMQRDEPIVYRESLEQMLTVWRSSKSWCDVTSMAPNRGLDEQGGSSGGGEAVSRQSSHEMIESVVRDALQSGEVAGGTELDDEEMADFTSFLVDGPGSPSPVAENATAEESNWQLEPTPLEFMLEGGFNAATAESSPDWAGLKFGRGKTRAYVAGQARRMVNYVRRTESDGGSTQNTPSAGLPLNKSA